MNAAQETHQSTNASKVGDDITHHTTIYLRKVADQTESAIYECEPYGISVDFEGFNVRRNDNQRYVEDNIIVAPSY